jgi:hypothetical protein
MIRVLLIYVAALLSGCASHLEFTPSDRYANVSELTAIEAQALPLPTKPQLVSSSHEGKRGAFIDAKGVETLLQYSERAETNTEALDQLLVTYNQLIDQHNSLVYVLKAEEGRSNFYNQMYVETENLRRDQQRQFMIDSAIQRTLLLLLTGMLVFQ